MEPPELVKPLDPVESPEPVEPLEPVESTEPLAIHYSNVFM